MNIKDIASLAGVSVATVSKIINRKDSDISKNTRKKVLDIVEKYNYIPYRKVIEKQPLKTNTVLFIIDEYMIRNFQIINIFEKILEENRYNLMLYILKSNILDKELSKIFDTKYINVAIIITEKRLVFVERYLENKNIYKIPIYLFEDVDEKINIGILINRERELFIATKYLLKLGHNKILNITKDKNIFQIKYLENLIDNKKLVNCKVEDIDCIGNKDILDWISKEYTAIICYDYICYKKIVKLLKNNMVDIPRDISIISLEYLSYLDNDITGINIKWEILAKIISEKIENILEDKDVLLKINTILKNKENEIYELKIGNSTARFLGKIRKSKIIVVGSINLDVNICIPNMPSEGESIVASDIIFTSGGKGANQAIGVAKLGEKSFLLGCIGNDSAGKNIYKNLIKNHVNVEGVSFDSLINTGRAYINVDNMGKSSIVLYYGANSKLSNTYIDEYKYIFDNASYCLLSTEIPLNAIEYTIDYCYKRRIPVMVKPSGISTLSDVLLKKIKYLILNKKEINNFIKDKISIEEKANILFSRGIENVIVTLGEDGCYLKNKNYNKFFSAIKVKVVDSTGGADAFISTLAVYLSEGLDILKAIEFAICSASICISGYGVQSSLPTREQIENYKIKFENIFDK